MCGVWKKTAALKMRMPLPGTAAVVLGAQLDTAVHIVGVQVAVASTVLGMQSWLAVALGGMALMAGAMNAQCAD